MAELLIVVDQRKDWKAYYPSDNVVTFDDYLNQSAGPIPTGTRVINLCRHYRYLSNGYYASLLAEARGHRVLPPVRTLNDLGRKAIYGLQMDELSGVMKALGREAALGGGDQAEVVFFFGTSELPALAGLARQLFEQFPCPILRVSFSRAARSTGGKQTDWIIDQVRAGALQKLTEAEEDRFATALDHFSRRVWRKPRSKRAARYDLAMFVDPEEAMPPSDSRALKRFEKAGKALGIAIERIDRSDYNRLAEFDGLFIRATTGIDNPTYRFAKKAEAEGLVVIDDSESILKCTNKVFLADLLARNRVPAPATRIISKDQAASLLDAEHGLSFPMVLKIPDGSFSRGIVKVENQSELKKASDQLFRRSSLLLVQEFMYTDYDWRIGVLAGKPLYACQYFMTKGHWQIYQHGNDSEVESGDFRTIPVHEAPRTVVQAAVKAAGLIGQGLYGVDLKQRGDRVVVIEVNDNPSIDAGVEDQFLQDDLYRLILEEMLRRMEARRRQ